MPLVQQRTHYPETIRVASIIRVVWRVLYLHEEGLIAIGEAQHAMYLPGGGYPGSRQQDEYTGKFKDPTVCFIISFLFFSLGSLMLHFKAATHVAAVALLGAQAFYKHI